MLLRTSLAFVLLFCYGFLAHATGKKHIEKNEASYMGSSQCAECHEAQFKAWQGSHHDMAMRHARAESVLGDFQNAAISFGDKTSRFFQRDNRYWANIEGPDGQFHDYQVKYTFGFEPLQQYMVEFGDGRVQLIPFAWDSRTKEEGGQRWFNLYPEQTQKHQEFYWTNTGQNWNYMCADCHSTNVKKNFDVETNTYKTTYSEINVGCEACHGPASEHIEWSKNAIDSLSDKGFRRDLSKSVDEWVSKAGHSTLLPSKINPSQQTLVCAQCHSRHVQISEDDFVASQAFGDRYLMSLINAQLYYPDGQVYDEGYVYGSFLQSKMNKNGVVCSNCHEPHSGKLVQPEKTVCLQCHQTQTYASQSHHHHQEGSPGAQCVNCHMPETTFMQVDARRDHGWHVPRPDFAQSLGTPDTCLSCHADKNSHWSMQVTQGWFPINNAQVEQPFAPVFSAIDQGYSVAGSQISAALSHIAQNTSNAAIIRASALERMAQNVEQNALIALARGVKDNDEHIRVGAIRGAEGVREEVRWRILAPLLDDTVLAVRSEAARALMPLWQQLSKSQQAALAPALDEYLDIQRFNADRGFAHTNIANVLMHQGKWNGAETAYLNSIRIDPYFPNAYINLADFYRQRNKGEQALNILKKGLAAIPDNANLHYSMGLAFIRAKQKQQAAEFLSKATMLEPQNAHFHYVYGLSLENRPRQAISALRKAYEVGANPQHLYALCEMQVRKKNFQAKQCLAQLRKVAPEQVVLALETKMRSKI